MIDMEEIAQRAPSPMAPVNVDSPLAMTPAEDPRIKSLEWRLGKAMRALQAEREIGKQYKDMADSAGARLLRYETLGDESIMTSDYRAFYFKFRQIWEDR